MKLQSMFVGKVFRKSDARFLPNGGQAVTLTLVFDGPTRDSKGIFVDLAQFSSKETNELPRVLDYVDKGSVIGVEGPLEQREWTDQAGNTRTSLQFSPYSRIHLLPRNGSADNAQGSSEEGASEADPFADSDE